MLQADAIQKLQAFELGQVFYQLRSEHEQADALARGDAAELWRVVRGEHRRDHLMASASELEAGGEPNPEKGHYPARSAFGAAGLTLGARVEVECIAALKE